VRALRNHWHHLSLHCHVRCGWRSGSPGQNARVRLASALLLGLSLVGCREAFRGLGSNAGAVIRNADQLFGAMVVRYSQVERDPKYELARNRLNRSALVPSRIFDDSTVWTSEPSPVLRALLVQGTPEDGRYLLAARPNVTRPMRLGESRHIITLARLSPNEYVWDTNVDFALGTVPAPEVGAFTTALLGSAERGSEQELRADYRAATPRTAAALGLLFSIDSIHATPFSDGTSDVTLTIGIHADALKERLPEFGNYVAKYINPAHYRFSLMDRTGAIWFDVQGADRLMRVHYRSAQGRLAPLYGTPRSRPDTLELHVDFTTKLKLFTVGLHNLVTEFVITDTPHERAWTIVAKREPDWSLPLITEHLIRSPLHHPFEGTGVIFHIGVRDSADSQTLLERRAHTTVQESAILRFLNSLGSGAMSDLADRTEREEEQYLREVFVALVADVRAVAPSFGAAPAAAPETGKDERR
jgi:hypothetical protein